MRREVRKHFGCDTLVGGELEDGGSVGTRSSHWEKRVFNNEYMTGSSSYNPRRSRITLALLEDSGWYDVDYSKADSFTFGEGEGCDFAQGTCDSWRGPYKCGSKEKGGWGCSWDRKTTNLCSLKTDLSPVPPFNQYFSDPTFGGDALADYCTFYKYFSSLRSDCSNDAFQFDKLFVRAESYGETSRCFESTLLHKSKSGLRGDGGCYVARCMNDELFIRIGLTFFKCSSNDEIRVADYNGRLKCPSSIEARRLCQTLPSVSSWPSIKSIEPSAGELVAGKKVTIKGTKLNNAAYIIIGNINCTNIQEGSSSTSLTCIFDKKTIDAQPPPPPPKSELLGDLEDTFFEKPQKQDGKDVVVVLLNGLTATLPNGYDKSSASQIIVAWTIYKIMIMVIMMMV